METFHFTCPIVKLTDKPFCIYDNLENKVGEIQRFYKSKTQKILEAFTDISVLNISVSDIQKNIKLTINEDLSFSSFIGKDKWHVLSNERQEKYTAYLKTVIATNPRILCKMSHDEILISKDFGEKITRFKNSKGKVIAEAEYESLLPPKSNNVRVTIFDEFYSIHEISGLYYMFRLKSM